MTQAGIPPERQHLLEHLVYASHKQSSEQAISSLQRVDVKYHLSRLHKDGLLILLAKCAEDVGMPDIASYYATAQNICEKDKLSDYVLIMRDGKLRFALAPV